MNTPLKAIVDARWVLTCKLVDGKKDARARLVATGYQDPDLETGMVETSGRVSLRSTNVQMTSLGALKNGNCGPWKSKILFFGRTPSSVT